MYDSGDQDLQNTPSDRPYEAEAIGRKPQIAQQKADESWIKGQNVNLPELKVDTYVQRMA